MTLHIRSRLSTQACLLVWKRLAYCLLTATPEAVGGISDLIRLDTVDWTGAYLSLAAFCNCQCRHPRLCILRGARFAQAHTRRADEQESS